MSSKSQLELEQPAKVYQLDALGDKVDEALRKLDQIVNSVNGVATQAQVEAAVTKVKEEIRADIDDEIKKIHLEYAPTKKAAIWVLTTIAGAFLIQLVYQLMNGG